MISIAFISAPFDINSSPIGIELFSAAQWSGVRPPTYFVNHVFFKKDSHILVFASISAPFDINSSPISFELFAAAIWSGVLFFLFNFL